MIARTPGILQATICGMGWLIAVQASAKSDTCPRTFDSGESISGGFQPGHFLPELTVHNGPTDHAIIKLERVSDGEEHYFYVAAGDSVAIGWIEPGEYMLSFAAGAVLASDCKTVRRARSIIQFSDVFDLYKTETVEPDGEIYTEVGNNWVTLFSQSDGDASASALSLSEFNN